MSVVRMPRSRTLDSMHFMRMPMYGALVPLEKASETRRAARAAAWSSSSSERTPKPSSKSTRRSSTGSLSSLARTRS